MTKTYPKDWFDISPDAYADFGAMIYLTGLSATHRNRSLVQGVYMLETPWRLRQYHIFRQNGFPRGYVTFAGLSAEAERRYALDGQPLMAEDFNSGPSFWIVDMVAPFGQTRQMVEILKRDIPHSRVRTNRMDSDLANPRIVEWTRDAAGKVHLQILRRRAFADHLDGAG